MVKYLKMDVLDISIEFIDIDYFDGCLMMVCFWYWVRKDVFFFIDECGCIWLLRLMVINLKVFDMLLDLVVEDRLESFEVVFDMYCYYGWDICLIMFNIVKVYNMIREVVEIGYCYFNCVIVGLGVKFILIIYDVVNFG